MERLDSVLKTVINHQKFLESQYGTFFLSSLLMLVRIFLVMVAFASSEAYKAYLEDVTSKCSTQNSNGKAKKKKDKDVQKTIGPFKYTYNQLEKDGIIKESEVPKERYLYISIAGGRVQPINVLTRCLPVQTEPHRLQFLLQPAWHLYGVSELALQEDLFPGARTSRLA